MPPPLLRGRVQTTNKAGRISTAKCINTLILSLVGIVVVFQLFFFFHYHSQTQQKQWQHQNLRLPHERHRVAAKINHANGDAVKASGGISFSSKEYTMWSKEEAYFHECANYFKMNDEWGQRHAPYCDKVEAKDILSRLNVPGLNIIPTLATLDKQNYTEYSLEFMKSIPQPYIIKATHVSGGVARVFNNTYHCFKYCNDAKPKPLDAAAFKSSKQQITEDINLDYSTLGGELQYKYITPRIIFEEDIISGGKTDTDVTFWWLTDGQPVFISHQCGKKRKNQQGFQMNRVFVSTDFHRLPIVFNRDTCPESDMPAKPKSWYTQVKVMAELGKQLFPGEVVRIDVYGGGDQVWFSEFTFSTAGCWRTFKPRVADGLLYAIAHGKVSPETATAEYVERLMSDVSWALVSFDEKQVKLSEFTGAYPSPVDMCATLEDFSNDNAQRSEILETCLGEAKKIKDFPLRCIITEGNGTDFSSFGVMNNDPLLSPSAVCEAKFVKLQSKQKMKIVSRQ